MGIAALGAGLVIVPLLGAEFWIWGHIAGRVTWLDRTWAGIVVSSAILAVPWAGAPTGPGWLSPALVFAGLLAARIIVPTLRKGAFGRTRAD